MARPAAADPFGADGAVDAAWLHLLDSGRLDERLVATSAERPGPARRAPLPRSLPASLVAALGRTGVESLYSHQLEALEAAAEGNVIVTSGTASGKSLSFNLSVLEAIEREPATRALYLYPTKALA